MAIKDTDLFVVQRLDDEPGTYKLTGAALKTEMSNSGGNVNLDGETLAVVCNRGSSAQCNRNMAVFGDLQISTGGTATGITSSGISTQGAIGCNGRLDVGGDTGLQNLTVGKVNGPGSFQIQRGGGTDGRVLVPAAIGLSGGIAQQLQIRVGESADGSQGLLQVSGWRLAENYVGDVDISNWCEALKKITISNYGPDIPIGINTQELHSESATTFLAHNETYARDELVPAFLVGVCKKQQELIENLTTRVAALEADHTAAMSNMNDSSY